MSKKNNSGGGIVYSTDKDFRFQDKNEPENIRTPGEQKLTVKLDTRNRGGKAVTIIDGYMGKDIEDIGKKLKVFCGTGGSVKNGQIFVQGDNRDKAILWLNKNDFKHVKKS